MILCMKNHEKIFVIISFLLLSSSALFANVELCFNYYFIPSSSRAYRCPDGDVASASYSLAGNETNLSIYFGGEEKNLDIGINLSLGTEFAKIVSFDWDNFRIKFAGEAFAALGPIFRYSFNDIHSVSVCPALEFNAGFLWDNISNIYGQFDMTLAINAMYKCYFLNLDGFHLGFNLGLGYGIPLAGAFTGLKISEDGFHFQNSTELLSGHDIKIFLGVCMNFGDRGIDRGKSAPKKNNER